MIKDGKEIKTGFLIKYKDCFYPCVVMASYNLVNMMGKYKETLHRVHLTSVRLPSYLDNSGHRSDYLTVRDCQLFEVDVKLFEIPYNNEEFMPNGYWYETIEEFLVEED